MAKFVFLLLVAIAAVLIWRIADRKARRKDPPAPPAPQQMVRCAECEICMPESDSISSAGRHFCCEAHQAAFSRRSSGTH